VLEFAILGLLHEAPMHGYVLRKRLHETLGTFRTFSYGSLYPTLRKLLRAGYLVEELDEADDRAWSRRGRRVYKLTAEGKERFGELLGDAGPQTWDDEGFGVRFAFFGRTDSPTRMRILEGRRSRLEERLDSVRKSAARGRERADSYTLELQRHGLESVEREVTWLTELIDRERSGGYDNDTETISPKPKGKTPTSPKN
jgi:DNA-binding PadR family transcriptional regulator